MRSCDALTSATARTFPEKLRNFSVNRFCTRSAYTRTTGYFTAALFSISATGTFCAITFSAGIAGKSTPAFTAICAATGANPARESVNNATTFPAAILAACAMTLSPPQDAATGDEHVGRLTIAGTRAAHQSRARQREGRANRQRRPVLQREWRNRQPQIHVPSRRDCRRIHRCNRQ